MAPPTADPARAWVISELYYPEETSTGYFVTYIAEGLARHRPVNVICSQPTYASRGQRVPWYEERNGTRIRRVGSARFDKNRLFLRVLNHLTFGVGVLIACVRHFRGGDLVLVVTNPPILPFLVAGAAWARGARTILLVHDVYPDVLVATGLVRARSPFVFLFAAASRWLYRRVERIVVLGRDMRRLVTARRDRDGDAKIQIISNWGDTSAIAPLPRRTNRLRARLELGDRFVVQYMGNMGRTHGLDVVVAAARRLREDPSIHFLFVGEGARKAALEAAVIHEQLARVSVLPSCPREELADYLNAADVAVVAFRPGMSGVSVPSRLYNVLAAGTPVIAVADENSEVAAVVREERVGWVVRPDDVDALVLALRHASGAGAERVEMSVRARAAAERRYTMGHVLNEYERLFAELDSGVGS
jgi:glycosyltransferase involved in cell wall biosynthesis